jgi:hypothetical protein
VSQLIETKSKLSETVRLLYPYVLSEMTSKLFTALSDHSPHLPLPRGHIHNHFRVHNRLRDQELTN